MSEISLRTKSAREGVQKYLENKGGGSEVPDHPKMFFCGPPPHKKSVNLTPKVSPARAKMH